MTWRVFAEYRFVMVFPRFWVISYYLSRGVPPQAHTLMVIFMPYGCMVELVGSLVVSFAYVAGGIRFVALE